ncbi:MAG: hypothetical protein V5B60_17200 [Accumulibacter sp.]|jgi:hypothetical protein|uniref:hypothetical protein n=1 Tax=Accumulibacter sp. TaxID=2053492 RepID=UPI002FC2BFF3
MKPRVLSCLLAAVVAPLGIPFTSGWVYFVLHEWFEPHVWGLPPLQSLIGVSINSTVVGYVFTWLYGLPLALVLRQVKRYRVSYLLAASTLPALTLPFWQTGWKISVLPVFLAGASTAYAFWLLTQWKAQPGSQADLRKKPRSPSSLH